MWWTDTCTRVSLWTVRTFCGELPLTPPPPPRPSSEGARGRHLASPAEEEYEVFIVRRFSLLCGTGAGIIVRDRPHLIPQRTRDQASGAGSSVDIRSTGALPKRHGAGAWRFSAQKREPQHTDAVQSGSACFFCLERLTVAPLQGDTKTASTSFKVKSCSLARASTHQKGFN